MVDVDVVVLGGGVCGVLAAQKLKEAGFTVKLVEKRENYGGVWSYRANPYSHLQVRPSLYGCRSGLLYMVAGRHKHYLIVRPKVLIGTKVRSVCSTAHSQYSTLSLLTSAGLCCSVPVA